MVQNIYEGAKKLKSVIKDIMDYGSVYFEIDDGEVDRFTTDNFSIEIDEDCDLRIRIKTSKKINKNDS